MHIEIGIVKLSGGSPGTIASDFVRSMMSPHKPAVLNLCRRPYGSGKEVPNKGSLSYINILVFRNKEYFMGCYAQVSKGTSSGRNFAAGR